MAIRRSAPGADLEAMGRLPDILPRRSRAEAGEGLRPASLFSENGLAHFNALQRAGVKRQNKEPHRWSLISRR